MIKTKLAKKVLTKAEQRHLTEDANVHSMAAFLRTIEQQREWDKGKDTRTCFECSIIARKLGV